MNKPSALDLFRGRYDAGDPQARDIQAILAPYGLRVSYQNPGPLGSISAVFALDKVYNDQGPRALSSVISILHGAWGYQRRAYVTNMIMGMAMFWLRYRDHVKKSRLVDRLSLLKPEEVLADAGVMRIKKATTVTLIGRSIRDRYNYGLRGDRTLGPWIDRPFGLRKDGGDDDATPDVTLGG
jgi:hypothetical protein